MRLVSVKCPECGGRVSLQEGADRVKCEYCGTTSVAQRRTRFLEVPVPPRQAQGGQRLPVATQVHSARWVAFALIVPVLLGGMISMVTFMKQRQGQTSLDDKYGWNSGNVILRDVNGDGTPDPIGIIWYLHTDPVTVYVAAFDGTNGERLWQSKQVGKDTSRQATLTLAGDTVVYANDVATLIGISVADGTTKWTSSLPEAPSQACAGPAGSFVFVTADDARHFVSVTDGKVTPAPASDECKPIATDAMRSGGPDAERVSWDIDNAYRPRELDGMSVGYTLIPTEGDVMYSFGTRSKGTYIPMVSAFRVDTSGDKPAPVVVWQQEVPATEPLKAYATEPLNATVDGDRVVVAYDMKDGNHRLACFERADGSRVWDVELMTDGWVFGIETTKDLVYVSDSQRLDVFSRADGSHVRTIAMPVY